MDKSNVVIESTVRLAQNVSTDPFVYIMGKTTIGKGSTIRSHTVIYPRNSIGAFFTTGHGVLIREGGRIGHHVSIGSHSVIEHSVVIGDYCRIHSNAFIPEFSILEDHSWIGPCVVFTNSRYPNSTDSKKHLVGVKIGEHAKIGAGAILLSGVRIGKHALVGAGSVVTNDVPMYAVVAGNPARIINDVRKIKDYKDDEKK